MIIAIVLQALWGLGRAALKTWALALLAAGAAGLCALGVNELLVLLVAGLLAAAGARTRRSLEAGRRWAGSGVLLTASTLSPAALGTVAGGAAGAPSVVTVFLVFAKAGAVLFGSGYVLLALLRADLVERLGWLTQGQLLDAVAVGQMTPGPVFTTATFIGYVLGGMRAATAATAGVFLPAFIFVAVSGPIVPRLRRSTTAGAFLDGVNAAALALMAVVTWQLPGAALVDGWTIGLAVLSAVLLLLLRVNSAWLVLGGGLVGVALPLLR